MLCFTEGAHSKYVSGYTEVMVNVSKFIIPDIFNMPVID